MTDNDLIEVEVAYALPHKQKIYSLLVPEGTDALSAVQQTSLSRDFEGVDLLDAKMGIFGKSIKKPDQHILQAGDRVEVYRPLKIDPKESRRKRAAKAKA